MNYNVLFSCISHVGNCRSMNQDNFICDGQYLSNKDEDIVFPLIGNVSSRKKSIFGIFDGMGGEECGEIASFIAAKRAATLVVSKDVVADILHYCLDVNEEICEYAKDNSVASMGTTAAILVFATSEIVLCNIGDSKIFRFYEGKIEQISYDHIVVFSHSTKPFLSQNLGIPSDELIIEPYVARGQYNIGDIYLICSDGLTDMLVEEEIKNVLTTVAFDKMAQALLDKARANGGRDNITIIVCKIEREVGRLKRIFKTLTKEV